MGAVSEKRGIESLELGIKAFLTLGVICAEEFKDGFQISDLLHIFQKIQDHPEIVEAFRHLKEIPGDASDLDSEEMVKLASLMLLFVPKFITALKR